MEGSVIEKMGAIHIFYPQIYPQGQRSDSSGRVAASG